MQEKKKKRGDLNANAYVGCIMKVRGDVICATGIAYGAFFKQKR